MNNLLIKMSVDFHRKIREMDYNTKMNINNIFNVYLEACKADWCNCQKLLR